MITKEVYQVFKDQLKAMSTDLNFYWPNVDQGEPEFPYVEFQNTMGDKQSRALLGGSQTVNGSITLTVCLEKNGNGGENTGQDYGETLANLFPYGTKYDITGGHVTVVSQPTVRQGFSTNSEWRTPVYIPYVARAS